jgi:hypothetical protein
VTGPAARPSDLTGFPFGIFFVFSEHRGWWALLGPSKNSDLAVSKRISCVSSELLDIAQDLGGLAL